MSYSSGDLVADRRFNLAAALAGEGDHAGACEVLEQALEIVPGWAAGWLTLGDWRQRAGAPAAAVAAFARAAALDPGGDLGADLRLAALAAAAPPEAMAAGYVRTLFDDYAPRFDRELVGRLGYSAPQRLAAALDALGDRRFASALDLGCGTGLMGQAIRGRVGRLAGFDLSEGMLRRAGALGLYDRLEAGDVVALMEREAADSFDLVLAADLMPYVGAPAALFASVARVLAPGGAFVFSAERLEGDGFVLGETLRYRHAPQLLAATAAGAGLTLLALEPASLRRERGEPVPGLVGLTVRRAEVVPLAPQPGPRRGGSRRRLPRAA